MLAYNRSKSIDSFQPHNQLVAQLTYAMNNLLLGVGTGIATLTILALVLLTSVYCRIRRAEQAYKESQRRLSSLIDSLPGIVYSCDNDAEWSMKYLSEGCFNLTGYKSHELVGKKAYNSITYPEDIAKVINTINQAIEQKQPYVVEYRIYTKLGEEKWVWEKGSGVFDDKGEVLSLEGFITDITDLKQTQKSLKNQQEFLRHVIDINPNCIFIKDGDGKFTLANQATAEVFGTTIADIVGKTDADFIANQEQLKTILCEDIEVMKTLREQLNFEETLTDPTGKERYYQTIKKPLVSSEGTRQVLGVACDISDRKIAESALRQSEARNRALLNAIPDLILRISKDGTYLDCKQAKDFDILLPDSELLGKTEYEVLPPALAQQRMHYVKRALLTGETQIFEYQLPLNGNIHHEEARIVVSGEDEVLAIIRDNTARKQAEAALCESEERFRCLSACSPVGIFLTDVEGKYTYTNPRCQEICGFSFEESLGKGWLQAVHPDDRESVLADWSACVQTSQKYLRECRFQLRAGIVRWAYVRTALMLSDRGELLGYVGTIEDITERKQAELVLQTAYDQLEIRVEERTIELTNANKSLQLEIAERRKAEAEIKQLNQDLKRRAVALEAANKELEAFSYSVSHDLRSPLRAINGFSRILLNEYAEQFTPEAQRYLQLVRDNAQQMGCLIDDLLTFSRLGRSPLKKHSVALSELLRQLLNDLHHQQQRQVEISLGDLPICQADPALLKQVWINLLANAFKFTRQQQVAQIEIGYQQTDGEDVYFVKDNGVGFDMRYAHKLFGVFQRLHRAEEYEGTGVGLAIVQRVIHRHGGRVWAEAEINKGAIFYFTLGGDTPDDNDGGRNSVSGRQPQRRGIDTPLLESQ